MTSDVGDTLEQTGGMDTHGLGFRHFSRTLVIDQCIVVQH